MVITEKRIEVIARPEGLAINGYVFDCKLPFEPYVSVLGLPSFTMDAGPPAPAGYRNNQVHIFTSYGIYLTEHHASRLIESVNFVFDPAECPFPIQRSFCGDMNVDGHRICPNMLEAEIEQMGYTRDMPGEYTLRYKNCWIGISTMGRRDPNGKRRKPRYVVRVSVCF